MRLVHFRISSRVLDRSKMWKLLALLVVFFKVSASAVFKIEEQCNVGVLASCSSVDLSDFTEIQIESDKIYPETKTFNSQYCKFPEIPEKLFIVFPNLESVSFFNVDLQFVNKESFRNAEKLETLNIHKNVIEVLPENLFASVPNLKTLQIQENSIRSVQATSFSGLKSLTKLNLRKNQIKLLPVGVFDDLLSLENLDLSFNQIEVLNNEIFINNRNLKVLRLNNNKIEQIGQRTFLRLNKLQDLQLFENNFPQLHVPSIENLHANSAGLKELIIHGTIEYLQAGNNDLKTIQIQDLSKTHFISLGSTAGADLKFLEGARGLETLKFDGSQPNLNDSRIFKEFKNLKTLVLKTDLTIIPDHILTHLKSLKELQISGSFEQINFSEILKLRKLEYLSLDSNQLAEFDFQRLFDGLKHLRVINLKGTQFSCEFLENLLTYMESKGIRHKRIMHGGTVFVNPSARKIGCINFGKRRI